MLFEVLFFGVTGAVLYNMFHDGKLYVRLMSYKKYYRMFGVAMGALTLYYMMKKRPGDLRQLLMYGRGGSTRLGLPSHGGGPGVFDVAAGNVMGDTNGAIASAAFFHPATAMAAAGGAGGGAGGGGFGPRTKRSVSETRKKFVASSQQWKCALCRMLLTHTYEIDHIQRLDQGGSNDVANLRAICPNCHRTATAMAHI
jgi:hypothetical protein